MNELQGYRIVILDQHPYIGGGQVVFLSILEALSETAAEVTAIIPFGGELEQAVRKLALRNLDIRPAPSWILSHGRKRWTDISKLLLMNLIVILKYWRLIFNSDLLYGNGPRFFPLLFVTSMILRNKRCVYHIHIDHKRLEKKIVDLSVRLGTRCRVVVNSRYTLSRLVAEAPSLNANPRVVVLENGLSPQFRVLRFVDRFRGVCERLRIAVIGEIRPEKGQDVAVRLAAKMPIVEMHLLGRIGRGAEDWVSSLRKKAPSNVTFHEPRGDVAAWIYELGIQVVVMPSRWSEPFGLVAIESMAASCITILSSKGGLVEIAEYTDALMFDNEQGLYRLVADLVSLSSIERSELAKRQYSKTMARYRDSFIPAVKNVIVRQLKSVSF